MGIRVIQQGDVVVTTEQLRRFTQEWEKFCSMHINPCGLEEYIRDRLDDAEKAGDFQYDDRS